MSSLNISSCRRGDGEISQSARIMATTVSIKAARTADRREMEQLEIRVNEAISKFREVDGTCTRFNPMSPLMRANASPRRWHRVPTMLFRALEEAKWSHDATAGRFDPRVLEALVGIGYDRTLDFGQGNIHLSGTHPTIRRTHQGRWEPRFRHGTHEVLIGDEPIDLGGIGKGLAVRWASEILASTSSNFLVEAGGDCYCAGRSYDGTPWRVGVEDPQKPSEPICVLAVEDRAVTTSSIRLRNWRVDTRRVHHLIDPKTGGPGGHGLVSVTVVGDDAARSEVWSKVLFIHGRTKIGDVAKKRSIAALWISEDGALSMSAPMERYVLWRRR